MRLRPVSPGSRTRRVGGARLRRRRRHHHITGAVERPVMLRRRIRTFLAVPVSAAVALIWATAATATAGAQTAQTAQTAQPADTPAAVPGAGASPTISATSQLSDRRYVASGSQAYAVGV